MLRKRRSKLLSKLKKHVVRWKRFGEGASNKRVAEGLAEVMIISSKETADEIVSI